MCEHVMERALAPKETAAARDNSMHNRTRMNVAGHGPARICSDPFARMCLRALLPILFTPRSHSSARSYAHILVDALITLVML